MRRFNAVLILLLCALLLGVTTAAISGPDPEPSARQPTVTPAPTAYRRQSPGKGQSPHAEPADYKPDQVQGWSLRVHQDLMADEDLY